jgi:hypothetical protein
LEDLQLRLEVMSLFMTDDKFMVQVLNSLTNEYKLQMLLFEKRIRIKENLLETETAKINNLSEEKALVVTQFKG